MVLTLSKVSWSEFAIIRSSTPPIFFIMKENGLKITVNNAGRPKILKQVGKFYACPNSKANNNSKLHFLIIVKSDRKIFRYIKSGTVTLEYLGGWKRGKFAPSKFSKLHRKRKERREKGENSVKISKTTKC